MQLKLVTIRDSFLDLFSYLILYKDVIHCATSDLRRMEAVLLEPYTVCSLANDEWQMTDGGE